MPWRRRGVCASYRFILNSSTSVLQQTFEFRMTVGPVWSARRTCAFGNEVIVGEDDVVLLDDSIHTSDGNGQEPVVQALNPAFLSQVPKMKLQVGRRTPEQLLDLDHAEPSAVQTAGALSRQPVFVYST